jgi:hypothetical protein
LFYVSSLLLATYTAVKTHGVSPLVNAAAMKTFGASYFGLWMIQNFLRPARMGLSVAISPGTDKIVEFFRRYVPRNEKGPAFALTVFCVNVLGTFAYMFGGKPRAGDRREGTAARRASFAFATEFHFELQ